MQPKDDSASAEFELVTQITLVRKYFDVIDPIKALEFFSEKTIVFEIPYQAGSSS